MDEKRIGGALNFVMNQMNIGQSSMLIKFCRVGVNQPTQFQLGCKISFKSKKSIEAEESETENLKLSYGEINRKSRFYRSL